MSARRCPADSQPACLALIPFTPLPSIPARCRPLRTQRLAAASTTSAQAHKGHGKITFCFPLKTQQPFPYLQSHHIVKNPTVSPPPQDFGGSSARSPRNGCFGAWWAELFSVGEPGKHPQLNHLTSSNSWHCLRIC